MMTGRMSMSSTKNQDKQDLLDNFCNELIKNLSGTISKRNEVLLRPDSGKKSYYKVRQKPALDKSDFEIQYKSVDELRQILENLWSSDELLKNYADDLAKLAFKLEKQITLDEELPAFVYTL